MQNQRTVTVFYDERVLGHRPDIENPFLPSRLERRMREILAGLNVKWSYPEHPGRVTTVMDLLEKVPVAGVEFRTGRPATEDELARVHTTAYIQDIYALRGKDAWLDVDTTAVSPDSVEAAEVAAGAAIEAVRSVLDGETGSAFALIRPPGHHAVAVRARGFCLFNNIAVAAANAQAVSGCRRILIVDWDAHHGNGTQDVFYADPDVLFFDTHRAAPFYPGSGQLEEIGAGMGEGTTVNVPLPGGSGDAAMLKAFREILVPAADWFEPDLVLVSCGFDPHRLDLVFNMSFEGFAALTGIVQDIADRHCGGKLVMVLEGGYHLDSIAYGTRAVLEVMAGKEPPEPEESGLAEVEAARRFHEDAFREI